MCALRLISNAIPKVTDKTFKRKYIALGRIVTQWRDIVGDKMADHAQPLKIHYRKPKRKGDPATATLDVATSSAQASLLVMQKGLILEKINHIFADSLITDIRFVHQTTHKPQTKVKKAAILSDEQKNSLSDMLDNIEDSELKARLASMGEAFFKDKN